VSFHWLEDATVKITATTSGSDRAKLLKGLTRGAHEAGRTLRVRPASSLPRVGSGQRRASPVRPTDHGTFFIRLVALPRM